MDVDIPFTSVFMLVLKVMIAGTIVGIVLFILYLIMAFLFLESFYHFRP